ncbi:hydrolase 2, exosortase A system-associated [Rhodoferax antarcticus]|uniref:Putative hydrolase, exosortase system type 1 associated n=1 Tax=Rhodoferax antarcticus ANT.BR TaxID=1111071 RepID=A0A1Q8YH02_9BURK|nr:hydrolase 2, exosortase A system-associated [Rhodoferax antarcticus]APW45117.1 hydrolase 2, exosortase A system-associated [Rhodoferax antarcticus]OLP07341.1 putative hydrolase, exosortase system type 1 associated [Rhodoferax antarcticus ANT.BR]
MAPSPSATSAFFIDSSDGQRFCLLHQPPAGQAILGQVIYVHPFAEEMNAARRMAAMQARALAKAGFVVLQIDLLGCGDSSGDFADATWNTWLQDLALAQRWMRKRWPEDPLWWWGLRAGSLLAAQACRASAVPAHLLLWQPVLSGKQHLNQFLRLQMAGDITRGEPSRGTAPLAQLLAQGASVEVAGYRVSAALAQGLDQADLEGLPVGSQIICLELGSPSAGDSLSPALSSQLHRWQQAGCTATAHLAEGAAFWQMQECPDSEAWVHTSLKALQAASVRGLP